MFISDPESIPQNLRPNLKYKINKKILIAAQDIQTIYENSTKLGLNVSPLKNMLLLEPKADSPETSQNSEMPQVKLSSRLQNIQNW